MSRALSPPFPAELVGWSVADVIAAEQPLLDAGKPLMQRAADGLAEVVREQLASSTSDRDADSTAPRVLALVGAGNNGGDALWACARIAADGVPVAVLATAESIHE
jgi:NAD(P)H-hydrate epimerase